MRSKVYMTVGCPSVCLSHRSTAAVACGGFAAGRPTGRRYRSVVYQNSGVSRNPVTTSVRKLAKNQTREFSQTLMKHED